MDNKQDDVGPAQVYEDYFVPGIHARWTPLFLEHAAPMEGERALDVACGTGLVARSLAPAVGTDGSVTGLDISPKMLAVARSLPAPEEPAIRWVQGDACDSLPDEKYELITCQQGFQFMDDGTAALASMRRALSAGGRVVMSVWKDLSHHPLYEALCEAEARYLGVPVADVSQPFSLGDRGALQSMLEETGFKRVEINEATRGVAFPVPDRFVALTILAAASIIPDTEMDDTARSELVEAVGREVAPLLAEYSDDETVGFPMHAHIARAYV